MLQQYFVQYSSGNHVCQFCFILFIFNTNLMDLAYLQIYFQHFKKYYKMLI